MAQFWGKDQYLALLPRFFHRKTQARFKCIQRGREDNVDVNAHLTFWRSGMSQLGVEIVGLLNLFDTTVIYCIVQPLYQR